MKRTVLERVKQAAPGTRDVRPAHDDYRRIPRQHAVKPESVLAMHQRLAINEIDGVIVAGARIVVPKPCRRQIQKDLVNMHQGSTKLRQRTRLSLYWTGMDRNITEAARFCKLCIECKAANNSSQVVFRHWNRCSSGLGHRARHLLIPLRPVKRPSLSNHKVHEEDNRGMLVKMIL